VDHDQRSGIGGGGRRRRREEELYCRTISVLIEMEEEEDY